MDPQRGEGDRPAAGLNADVVRLVGISFSAHRSPGACRAGVEGVQSRFRRVLAS